MKTFTIIVLSLVLTWFTYAEDNAESSDLEAYARNLDPAVGCVRPKTRNELQQSINALLAARTPDEDVPIELVLCKDTNVEFEDGDPRINIQFPEGQSFSMRCKFKQTCRISGGYSGGTGRNFLGKAGFLIFESFSHRGRIISFEGITFSNFGVTNDGGVFYFFSMGNLMVQFINCRFHRNQAGFSGGVAFIESANGEVELRIKHSHIKENKAGRYGGAFAIKSSLGTTHTLVSHSKFYGNEAKADGGAIAYGNTLGNHMLVVQNSEFEENKAKRDGGALFLMLLNPVELSDSIFKNNKADVAGDAYFAIDSQIQIDDVDFHSDTTSSYARNKWRRL